MITRIAVMLLVGWLVMTNQELQACDAETPCDIDAGSYHLALPDDWDGETALPAIVFFHGHRSSGRSVMNGSVRSIFGKSGYAVIAPNGQMWPDADYRYWPGRPLARAERDDVAFTEAVVDDVAGRIPLNRERILVAGFSAGGSMAWMIACYRGDLFAGYVSIAGALRRPTPSTSCPGGPARMLHIHGFADAQVPLEGRAIRDWHQGDVFASLDLLRSTNGCESKPSAIEIDDPFWCRNWNACSSGADIDFCLHDGGHGMPEGWVTLAKDWFER
ncbi:MAG: PHB depolymerase family esterase [Pseudomonadota bacterium]